MTAPAVSLVVPSDDPLAGRPPVRWAIGLVTVSPKYSAEHMGLPCHQAGIRVLERPAVGSGRRPVSEKERFMAVSEGSRPFTHYGYGDFLREGRPYDVVNRPWPGTQRLLLCGGIEALRGCIRGSAPTSRTSRTTEPRRME